MESVFLTKEGGITETAASKIAAVANSKKLSAESILQNLSFINEEVSIVGTPGKMPTHIGTSSLNSIQEVLRSISTYNGLIAWLREAQKALEKYKKEISNIALSDYCKTVGMEFPNSPERPEEEDHLTFEDGLDLLAEKERARYLALEAKAAALGKVIHPNGEFCKARKELYRVINSPVLVMGEGRDLTVYYRTPSADVTEVDNTFNEIEATYQETESNLNHMKLEIRNKIDKVNLERDSKFREALTEYNAQYNEYRTKMKELQSSLSSWQINELAHLPEIKVPAMYEELVENLSH